MTTDRDLVQKLLTLAGTIMEDVSAIAIIDDGNMTLEGRIAAVRDAAEQVLALTSAAHVAVTTDR